MAGAEAEVCGGGEFTYWFPLEVTPDARETPFKLPTDHSQLITESALGGSALLLLLLLILRALRRYRRLKQDLEDDEVKQLAAWINSDDLDPRVREILRKAKNRLCVSPSCAAALRSAGVLSGRGGGGQGVEWAGAGEGARGVGDGGGHGAAAAHVRQGAGGAERGAARPPPRPAPRAGADGRAHGLRRLAAQPRGGVLGAMPQGPRPLLHVLPQVGRPVGRVPGVGGRDLRGEAGGGGRVPARRPPRAAVGHAPRHGAPPLQGRLGHAPHALPLPHPRLLLPRPHPHQGHPSPFTHARVPAWACLLAGRALCWRE